PSPACADAVTRSRQGCYTGVNSPFRDTIATVDGASPRGAGRHLRLMCGIAGVFNRNGRPVHAGRVRAMGDTLRHRGPDADGVWADGPVGLAHRRLSVLDLSAAGRQPMGNEDGDVQVCYNGEIYNFDELRRELEAHGHVFRSATDTEVIVHAWEQWGRAAWARFNGMF